MKKLIKQTKYGASLIALAFSLSTSTNVQAQTCTTVPTCDELGYTKSASDCSGLDYLKCPFDNSKYFCTAGGGNANCTIGDILYSDKTCNANVVSGKTPIGVVFDVANRLAIAKSTKATYWSADYFDVDTLPNITFGSDATADWQGKNNTKLVLTYCKANSKNCPAFEYVNSYMTAGTKTGDWYLPSGGELNAIYGNKGVLNTALSKIGGQALPNEYHWASSEKASFDAWSQSFGDGYITNHDKCNYKYVRPVIAF